MARLVLVELRPAAQLALGPAPTVAAHLLRHSVSRPGGWKPGFNPYPYLGVTELGSITRIVERPGHASRKAGAAGSCQRVLDSLLGRKAPGDQSFSIGPRIADLEILDAVAQDTRDIYAGGNPVGAAAGGDGGESRRRHPRCRCDDGGHDRR